MEKGVRDFWPKQLQKANHFIYMCFSIILCNWFSPSQKISIVYTSGLHSLCCQMQSDGSKHQFKEKPQNKQQKKPQKRTRMT